jgi:membrane-associated phospholipid phosphatase
MNGSIRAWLIAFAACAAAALFSIAYVDRPVANYVHLNLLQSQMIEGLASAINPLVIFVALAFAVLFGAGCCVLAGRKLSAPFETPLLCSWSVVWAMAATEALKLAFGRSEPVMWTGSAAGSIERGTYRFLFLHGVPLYESFPSGTTAIAAAILSVLWIRVPRLRVAWALVLAYVGLALIVTNGHFVSDVITGGFLGVSTGWMTLQMWRRNS